MSRTCLVASIFCFTLACGTSAPPATPSPAEPNALLVEVGAEEFARYCAACHGADARGDGPAAGALRTPPADLTRIAARRAGDFPADEIAAWIDGRLAPPAHGTREMPIWGVQLREGLPPGDWTEDLVRGRILTLVEYLRSIQVE